MADARIARQRRACPQCGKARRSQGVHHTVFRAVLGTLSVESPEWGCLPIPNGPLTDGIDGGYVKAQGKQGWFEVIAGKSLLAFTRG